MLPSASAGTPPSLRLRRTNIFPGDQKERGGDDLGRRAAEAALPGSHGRRNECPKAWRLLPHFALVGADATRRGQGLPLTWIQKLRYLSEPRQCSATRTRTKITRRLQRQSLKKYWHLMKR